MRFSIPHVIYNAELPQSIKEANDLLSNNLGVTLFANELTPELRKLSMNPNVQLRFSDSNIKID